MASDTTRDGPLRVVVVDDSDDIRLLLRIELSTDDRFELVGEGSNGRQAIDLARSLQPDLVILDRLMPELGGTEAIPEIRRHAPDAAILLYTANADPTTSQAALDAGALGVLDKVRGSRGFVEHMVDALLQRVSGEERTMEVRVGPVASAAARVWIANTRRIVDAAVAHPEITGADVPPDVVALFHSFLDQWAAVAEGGDEFLWVARAKPDEVTRVVTHWAALDAMTDEQLAALGVAWSPPDGEPFFRALTAGVLDALRVDEGTQRLAARLSEQWAP